MTFVEIIDDNNLVEDSTKDMLLKLLACAAEYEGVDTEITEMSLSFVSKEEIQEINRDYRGKDVPTDVISFALNDEVEDEIDIIGLEDEINSIGDVIICVDIAHEQAKEYEHSFDREIGFLAVHGFLHLLGYDHMTEEDEKEMIHSIVTLGETSAKEVMTPRTSMFALEGEKTINEIWDEITENGFSRIPVYEETIDNIIGILYVKDLMEHVKNNELDIPIKQFIRSAYFVPETKSIIEILKEFRGLKVHIAMVLDEYGGVVGLVTIEDLIEEIVGEIRDEYDDEEESFFKKIADNEYEVDAMTDIETINKDLELNLPISEDYESLGGLIVTTTGKICEVGDEVQIDNIYLKVLEVDKMRVSKVFIRILEEVKEEE
mgnify:CR=1 FL=1